MAAEKSLGRLFLAGIGPGLLLVSLFATYAVWRFRREYEAASAAYAASGTNAALLLQGAYAGIVRDDARDDARSARAATSTMSARAIR